MYDIKLFVPCNLKTGGKYSKFCCYFLLFSKKSRLFEIKTCICSSKFIDLY